MQNGFSEIDGILCKQKIKMMNLSEKNLQEISKRAQDVPEPGIFNLPEKILQFGTGVLLRGLPDYFIDQANKKGLFNGRIVMVKSTAQGNTDVFSQQDNLYTICVRGVEKGKTMDETMINASISRVLSADQQWEEVLACARNPEMQIVISNTTEAGLVLADDNPQDVPPRSFPGKLLAFLLERYRCFNGSSESGMIIIPTELIPDNGKLLKEILISKLKKDKPDAGFAAWLETANEFCSSLVDCIVPGSPPEPEKSEITKKLGYRDDLLIVSEVYRLWAIESASVRSKAILSFSGADKRVIISPDISKFRELKLRLLNGAHTFTCGLAVWAGFPFVKQAMANRGFSTFITRLLQDELAVAVESPAIPAKDALAFADDVLDRFRNPFLQHRWLSICLQYSSKMKTRNVQNIRRYYEKKKTAPPLMAAGFAGWLLFMRTEKKNGAGLTGSLSGKEYILQDDAAEKLFNHWNKSGSDTEKLVNMVLQDSSLWAGDLTAFPGFAAAVTKNLELLMETDPTAFFTETAIHLQNTESMK
jgi:tagaturonate reductase